MIQPLADVLADRADQAAGRPQGPSGFSEVSSDAVLPAAPDAEPVLVWVDGVRHRAVRQQRGLFTARQMVVNRVAVTVVAQDTDPNDLGLVRLLDLPDLLNRTEREFKTADRADSRDRRAWAAPPDQSEPLWAHRGVVALTLAAHQGERPVADRPRRSWDEDWGLWWEAACDEQMSRTGRTRSAAMDSVGVMANQLGELSRTADWWSDEPVRQAAIAQVIWYTVTGDNSISASLPNRSGPSRNYHLTSVPLSRAATSTQNSCWPSPARPMKRGCGGIAPGNSGPTGSSKAVTTDDRRHSQRVQLRGRAPASRRPKCTSGWCGS